MNYTDFYHQLAESLAYTLLHSLWQGAILYILLRIILFFVKSYDPSVKYILNGFSLLFLLGWMAFTFIHHLPEISNTQVTLQAVTYERPISLAETSSIVPEDDYISADKVNLTQKIQVSFLAFMDRYAAVLVNLWLFGAFLFSVRWLISLYFTNRLKSNALYSIPDEWQERLGQLSDKLMIRRAIRICESAQVSVPLVLGHLKPLILLPIGTLSGLSTQQLEAVLLHELAHIKRHDFLMNILLTSLEVLLFYHPVYWWISGNMQEAREQCCDDIALAHTGNPKLYAETLLKMEKQRQQNSLAMAYQGKKQHLLHRIKRICVVSYEHPQRNLGKTGISILMLSLVAITALAQLPQPNKDIPLAKEQEKGPEESKELLFPISEVPEPEQEEGVISGEKVPDLFPELKKIEESLAKVNKALPELQHISELSQIANMNVFAELKNLSLSDSAIKLNMARLKLPEIDLEIPEGYLKEANEKLEIPEGTLSPPRLQNYLVNPSDLPKIPSMRRKPKPPVLPEFGLTEAKLKKMSYNAEYPEEIKEYLNRYNDQVKQWRADMKADYLNPWIEREDQLKELYKKWSLELSMKYKGDASDHFRLFLAGRVKIEKELKHCSEALNANEQLINEQELDLKLEIVGQTMEVEDDETEKLTHAEKMKLHESKMALHDLRMSIHHSKMDLHHARMNIHETYMLIHHHHIDLNKQLLKELKTKVLAMLEKDGFGTSAFKIVYSGDNEIKINGKILNETQAEKYRNLIEEYNFSSNANRENWEREITIWLDDKRELLWNNMLFPSEKKN